MQYLLRDSSGYTSVSIESNLLRTRDIFIKGEITSDSAIDFHMSLMSLVREETTDPIRIWISSCGGDVQAALFIIDLIRNCPCEVQLIACDKAYSAAALILAAGPSGRRYVVNSSEVMIHEISTNINGQYTSIKNMTDKAMRVYDRVNKILSESTGRNISDIESSVAYDNFMTAEEAVEFGLADCVLNEKEVQSVILGKWR